MISDNNVDFTGGYTKLKKNNISYFEKYQKQILMLSILIIIIIISGVYFYKKNDVKISDVEKKIQKIAYIITLVILIILLILIVTSMSRNNNSMLDFYIFMQCGELIGNIFLVIGEILSSLAQ